MKNCLSVTMRMAICVFLVPTSGEQKMLPAQVTLVRDDWNIISKPVPGLTNLTETTKVPGLYIANIEFTSPMGSQILGVAVDTGSSVLNVASRPNLGSSSPDAFYHGSCNGSEVTFKYGAGTMIGHLCESSSPKLGGLSAEKPVAFMGIDQFEGTVNPLNPRVLSNGSRGILGMAFSKLSDFMDPNFSAVQPLVDDITKANNLPNVFSVQMCGQQGHMTIGGSGIGHEIGTIAYTPVICDTVFCVNVTRIGTSVSHMVEVPPPIPSTTTPRWENLSYVDSGNPFLYLPVAAYNNVEASINKQASDAGIGNATTKVISLQCSLGLDRCACVRKENLKHLPEIWIELQNSVLLKVPSSKYMQLAPDSECYSPLVHGNTFGGVLGIPVLESHYAIFDKDRLRIGFAPTTGCSNEFETAGLSSRPIII